MFYSPLRVGILQNGPFEVNVTSDGMVKVIGGPEAILLDMVTVGLKLPFILQVPKDAVWGIPEKDGNWTGLLGMVQREEVDMAIGSIFVSKERMSIATFSFPYTWVDITFATRKPGLLAKGANFMWPFDHRVWICLAVSIVILTISCRILQTKKYTLSKIFLGIFGILLQQPPDIEFKDFRNRCLVISWMAGCTVISYSYMVVLLSFLTVPMRERPIETASQLSKAVQQGRIKCVIPVGSNMAEILKSSIDESNRIIGHHIWKKKGYINLQIQGALARRLKRGNLAYIDNKDRIKMFFQSQFFISRQALFTHPSAIALNKKFRYKKRLNRIIKRISAAGLYEKSIGDYLFKKELTSKYPEPIETDIVKQLTMTDLYGAFLVLAGGGVLAISVFLVELLYFQFFKK